MREKITHVYQFDELSDTAKEKAREWYRTDCLDFDWWSPCFESFVDAAKYLGIEIDTRKSHSHRKQPYIPAIYFSGFASQGDGACFYGTWRASEMKTLKALKADFGTDTKLWQIHKELLSFAKRYPQAICTSTRSSSNYSHERSTNLEAVLGEEINYNEATHKPLEECLVDFMRWMYRSLEKEYDYRMSNESVDESLTMNQYEFDEGGNIA